MITKEIQRAGIPVIQVTNLTKIAEGIGSNRILRGNSVLHVFGDPTLPLPSEQAYREKRVEKALHMLEEVPAEGERAIIEEYFLNGQSPMLPATPHAALVRSDICMGLLPAARKRA